MSRTSGRIKVPPKIRKFFPQRSLTIPAPTAEILPLQKKLGPLLRRAWVNGSKKDVSWLTADLAALWEVSRVHIILVRKLLKMARKPDKERLQDISQELDVNWFSNARGHLESFERELARFKQSLYTKRHAFGPKRKRVRRSTSAMK